MRPDSYLKKQKSRFRVHLVGRTLAGTFFNKFSLEIYQRIKIHTKTAYIVGQDNNSILPPSFRCVKSEADYWCLVDRVLLPCNPLAKGNSTLP